MFFFILTLSLLSTWTNAMRLTQTSNQRLLSRNHNENILNQYRILELSQLITNFHHPNLTTIQKMRSLVNEFKLHPFYASNLPKWIKLSWNKLLDQKIGIHEFQQLMDILNTHYIGFYQTLCPPLNKLSDSHRLLLLTSRGLMQFIAPTMSGESNLECVPWMESANDTKWVPFFTLVYEYLLCQQFNLSSLDSIYDLTENDHRKHQLLQLMNHGLIVWNKKTMNEFRTNYYHKQCNHNVSFWQFIEDWLEIHEFISNFSIDPWSLGTLFMMDIMNRYDHVQDDMVNMKCIEFMMRVSRYNHDIGEYDTARLLREFAEGFAGIMELDGHDKNDETAAS